MLACYYFSLAKANVLSQTSPVDPFLTLTGELLLMVTPREGPRTLQKTPTGALVTECLYQRPFSQAVTASQAREWPK